MIFMKKKILFVYPEFMVGGSTTSLINLLNEIDYKKYEVDLALRKKRGLLMKYIPQEVNLLDCLDPFSDNIFGKISKLFILLFSKRFYQFLYFKITKKTANANQVSALYQSMLCRKVKKKYDVAIGFLEGFSNAYVNSKKVSANKKVSWIHVDYAKAGFNIKYDYNTLLKSDVIAFVSETCLDNFAKLSPELKSKSVVVENVNSKKTLEIKSKEFVPEITNLNDSFFKILTVCRIDTNTKGIDRVFNILRKLINEKYNVQWAIIGGQPDKKFNELYEKFEYKNNLLLLGEKINPFPYYSLFDVFVLPSRFEGKPMAVGEALLLNLPVVVTHYSSANEQIKNGYNGIIVENDEYALYSKLKSLIDNYQLLINMRANLIKDNKCQNSEIGNFEKII